MEEEEVEESIEPTPAEEYSEPEEFQPPKLGRIKEDCYGSNNNIPYKKGDIVKITHLSGCRNYYIAANKKEESDWILPECINIVDQPPQSQGGTIRVENVNADIDVQSIHYYFRNKKKSGGGHNKVEIDFAKKCALVTFDSPEIAKRVLERPHTLSSRNLDVSLFDPTQEELQYDDRILIENLNQDSADTESLTNFIEAVTEIDVQHIELLPNNDKAIITFAEKVAIEVIRSKIENKEFIGRLLMVNLPPPTNFPENEEQIEVSVPTNLKNEDQHRERPFEKKLEDIVGSLTQSGKKFQMDPRFVTLDKEDNIDMVAKTNCLEVKGFDQNNFDQEKFEMYFENPEIGGGPIKDITFEGKKALLTFEDPEDAKRVLSREHIYSGSKLEITQYVPPPPPSYYRNCIYVTDIPKTADEERLRLFLENVASNEINGNILYGKKPGTAMVTFKSDIDFEKIDRQMNAKQLCNECVKYQRVPITNCIIVKDEENSKLDEEKISLYFSNKRKSDGGNIEKTTLIENGRACLVFFKDSEVVTDVCKRKHSLKTLEFTVQPFHVCLGAEDTEEEHCPSEVEIEIGHDILKYIQENEDVKHEMDVIASTISATIFWNDGQLDKLSIKYSPNDSRQFVENGWDRQVHQLMTDYIRDIKQVQFPTKQEIIDDAFSRIKEQDMKRTKVYKKTGSIEAVGPQEEISRIESIIEKTKEEYERAKHQTMEHVTIEDKMKLDLLEHMQWKEALNLEIEVSIDQDNRVVTFQGNKVAIAEAKYKLFEVCQNFKSDTIKMKTATKAFIMTPPVWNYIQRKLKENNLIHTSVLDTECVTGLKVMTHSDEALSKLRNLLCNIVTERKCTYKKESVCLDDWDNTVSNISSQYGGCVELSVDERNCQIVVRTVEEYSEAILVFIKEFLENNTIATSSLKCSKGTVRYLKTCFKDNLSQMSLKCKVKINYTTDTIEIRGSETGIGFAKEKVCNLIDRVKKKRHQIKKPGIDKYFTFQGREQLDAIETRHRCAIEIDNSSIDGGGKSSKSDIPTEKCHCTMDNGVYVRVLKCDITDLEVDVITNAANDLLDHAGGLAAAIVKKGGKSIQTECQQYIQAKGRMQAGRVYCSKPGNLRCKVIVHAVGPIWNKGYGNEENELHNVVINVLKEAHDGQYQSVALPAISTGIYNFPMDKATEIIVKAMKTFLHRTYTGSIKTILFCDTTEKAANSFTESMKKQFKGVKNIPKGDAIQSQKSKTSISKVQKASKQKTVKPETVQKNNHIEIKLCKGEIAKQEVDIIVNTTSLDLNLAGGGVSTAILKAAGDELQQICHRRYPNGIQYGEVAITEGAALPCQFVFHGALPNYKPDGSSLQVLESFMLCCLDTADKEGLKSIAFPALGTGNLSFPKEVVARQMFKVAKEFSTNRQLCEIRFVFIDDPVLQTFEKEKSFYDDANVSNQTKKARGKNRFKNHSDNEDNSDEEDVENGCFQIGKVMLKVYQGDITEVYTTAIVNSTDNDFSLGGGVATIIARKGGNSLTDEVSSKLKKMKQTGIAVTSSGSQNTKYKNIIHLSTEDIKDQGDWCRKLTDVFILAEDRSYQSLGLPALGTGMRGQPIENLVNPILQSILKFEPQSIELREIHMVIFDPSQAKDFIKEMRKQVNAAKEKQPDTFFKFIRKAVGSLAGFAGKHTPNERNIQMTFQPNVVNNEFVELTFFAESNDTIQSAIIAVEDYCFSVYTEKKIQNDAFKILKEEQLDAILSLKDEHDVEIITNDMEGSITIRGLKDDVMTATTVIQGITTDALLQKHQEDQAKLVAQIVEWAFIDVTDTGRVIQRYPKDINNLIESAYRNHCPQVSFEDNEEDYVIDFTKMVEYPANEPDNTVCVVRKDKIESKGDLDIPSFWKSMKDAENIDLVLLKPQDPEYKGVETNFRKTLGTVSANIIKIERLQNKSLFQQYEAKKKAIQTCNPPDTTNEQILWHGTSHDTVESINEYGFNRGYCGKNGKLYGEGVYFALYSSYSAGSYSPKDGLGHRRIYQCRVLTGVYTKGSQDMRVAPKRKQTSSLVYDSVVNNESNPEIFVIFHDSQAYPEYLITFT